MAEFFAAALFIASMAVMTIYTYYVLRTSTKTPCSVVIFPVGRDTPVDILVAQTLQGTAGWLPSCSDYEFLVLDLGADRETLLRIELLQRDHPYLRVAQPDELQKILCNTLPSGYNGGN